jgi:glycosyltransferase involved in cell wall biosynthesis
MTSALPRILFVDQSGELGGAELTLLDVVKDTLTRSSVILFDHGPFQEALERAGANVSILPLAKGVKSFRKDSGAGAAAKAAAYLPRMILRLASAARNCDIVFANTQKAFAVASVAAMIAHRPCIWYLMDIVSPEHFSAISRLVCITLANRFDVRVIANSEATMASFLAAGGRRDRVSVVRVGIDRAPFSLVAGKTDLRRQYGVNDALLVGSFSRISPWKGQHVLIDAMSRTPDLHAIIVGKPLFGEDNYLDQVRMKVEQLGLRNRVHFHGFTSDVATLLADCDILVHTSTLAEPFGRVLVEGMLAEKPVIAAAAGGPLEIIQDGQSGLLVKPDDAEALAAALVRLAGDPGLRHDIAEEGRRRAEALFSLPAMLEGIHREIQECLAEYSPVRHRRAHGVNV